MQRTECVLDANRVQNDCVVRTFEHKPSGKITWVVWRTLVPNERM